MSEIKELPIANSESQLEVHLFGSLKEFKKSILNLPPPKANYERVYMPGDSPSHARVGIVIYDFPKGFYPEIKDLPIYGLNFALPFSMVLRGEWPAYTEFHHKQNAAYEVFFESIKKELLSSDEEL